MYQLYLEGAESWEANSRAADEEIPPPRLPPFMEPEESLTCSQEPATGHYPNLDDSGSRHQTPFIPA
jgi:hypothetical protein